MAPGAVGHEEALEPDALAPAATVIAPLFTAVATALPPNASAVCATPLFAFAEAKATALPTALACAETLIVPLPVLVWLLADLPLPRLAAMPRRALADVCAVAVAAVLVVAGTPVWAAANRARLSASPAWKISDRGLSGAEAILHRDIPRGLVLAPATVMSAIAVTTTRVYTVVPRILYLEQLHTEDARKRRLLFDWVSGERYLTPAVLRSLTSALKVSEVCLPSAARQRLRMLAAHGFPRSLRADWLTCRLLPASDRGTGEPTPEG